MPPAPPQAVILSHDLWVRRFGGRSEAIGSTIRFARGTATVVGVMPPDFFVAELPDLWPVDCWLLQAPDPGQRRVRYGLVLGRLESGISLATAQRELDTITADIEREYPQDNRGPARQLFAGNRAVGQTLLVDKNHATVVGVMADVRPTGLEVNPDPTVYFPSVQQRSRTNNLVIRTTGDPAIVPAVRAILREIDPVQALSRIHVLDELLDDAKAPRRFAMQLVGGFSLLAVLLAMIGLYGVIAESVAQRVPEIGIRMALGARADRITQMVLTRSALMVAAGLAIGLAGAVALRGLMGRFIFGVEAGDPVSCTVACSLLLAAAFCASLIPARRAAAIDPLQALRRE